MIRLAFLSHQLNNIAYGEFSLTLPDCECGGIDQEQQDVVEKALEHGRVGVVISGQVLAGQSDPADEQRQDLTESQREEELSVDKNKHTTTQSLKNKLKLTEKPTAFRLRMMLRS